MAEVKVKLTKLGAILRTIRHGVINRLSTEDMTRVCVNEGVLICVF